MGIDTISKDDVVLTGELVPIIFGGFVLSFILT
jgi:hypothetical protein